MIHYRIVIVCVLVACGFGPLATAQSPPSRSRLVRILTGRSESVRLHALLRLRHDTRLLHASLDELIVAVNLLADDLGDSELTTSLVEMVRLIGSVDRPESESALVELLESENSDIAMICAESLGRNKFYGAVEHLQRQVDRPDYASRYAFRFNLVRALALMRHPDAIEVLGKIEPSLDGQLRYEVEQILEAVTLDDFRGDENRYEAWRKRSEDDSIFRVAKFTDGREPESYAPIKFVEPRHYYGIEIRARRVLFVIDHSGSMKARAGSGSRLMLAKQELIRAIRELPEDSEFSIVSYDSRIHPWREKLSTASKKEKMAAINYVQRLAYGSDTNTYGALRRALDFDDSLEAVFLLTDGKPTSGQIIAPLKIANDILHRNRWRHLNINTIGISVGGATERFLRSLAEDNGGEFRATR